MTLIEVRGVDGKLIGRCDARCYEAQHSECTCICGGKNHGRGIHQAVSNIRNELFCDSVRRQFHDFICTVNEITQEKIEEEVRRRRKLLLERPKTLKGAEYMNGLFEGVIP